MLIEDAAHFPVINKCICHLQTECEFNFTRRYQTQVCRQRQSEKQKSLGMARGIIAGSFAGSNWVRQSSIRTHLGISHIDDVVSTPENSARLLVFSLVSTILGIVFGWLFWKHGLESAILAHFMVDAVNSGIVIPAYLSYNVWVYTVTICGLLLAGFAARRLLRGHLPPI